MNLPLSKLSPNIKGPLWMLGMVVSLSLLAIAARELSERHSPFELLLARHGISLLIILPFIIFSKKNLIKTNHLNLHIFRNTSHFAATAGWFIAITLIPLAEVFAIEFTTPIWVAILAVIFLKEKLNKGRVIALILGIIGVLIILRPGFNQVGLGSIIMVISAIGFAITNASTKALTKYDKLLTVLLWMSLIQLPLSLIPAIFYWNSYLISEIPWIIIVGLTGLSAHFSLTRALQLADASLVNPIDFLRLPLIAIAGYLIYSENIDLFVILGAIIIFVGNYYSIWKENKK